MPLGRGGIRAMFATGLSVTGLTHTKNPYWRELRLRASILLANQGDVQEREVRREIIWQATPGNSKKFFSGSPQVKTRSDA